MTQLDAQLLEYKPQVEEVVEHGVKQSLETSALGLTFRVRANHVGVGLRLECTASIGSVYWQSFQVVLPTASVPRHLLFKRVKGIYQQCTYLKKSK